MNPNRLEYGERNTFDSGARLLPTYRGYFRFGISLFRGYQEKVSLTRLAKQKALPVPNRVPQEALVVFWPFGSFRALIRLFVSGVDVRLGVIVVGVCGLRSGVRSLLATSWLGLRFIISVRRSVRAKVVFTLILPIAWVAIIETEVVILTILTFLY